MQILIVSIFFIALIFLTACSNTENPGLLLGEESTLDFQITSANFTETRPRKRIPSDNTCFGENLSPPLSWINAPQDAKSFALIAEDVDHSLKVDLMGRGASSAGEWVLWVLYNIPVEVSELTEGIPTTTMILPDGTTQGTNDNKKPGYFGPCPPAIVRRYLGYDYGAAHRYYFRLYALDQNLVLEQGLSKKDLLDAINNHILAKTEVMGKYTPPMALLEKGGSFLSTSNQQNKDKVETETKQQNQTREHIYNSFGALITATPQNNHR